ncbi:HNH endonuclease [Glaciecola sp. KUL10]|uniref:HNH endonuclease n=1 Tax=Glaciecola sp. (strain KUL10) TaxID=2161813 RepID=UPI000D787EC1|nr:HNH endonuclease signature motif containing protein [Glaciecola sp. KUL10]GBL03168.1 hypothetical protein KUL10_04490 [Glaciecola sp. KUL10]
MKLNVDLKNLWAKVDEMRAEYVAFDVSDVWHDSDIEFDDQLSSSGIEIDLDDIESEEGLLSVRGRQVLLFIPDHAFKVEKALLNGQQGNKFHVADCTTLETMKKQNRFNRYKVTNNMSGRFEIYGTSEINLPLEGITQLHVCKNCINQLNYKGIANASVSERNKLVENFDLEEFFTTYSSLFKRLPRELASNKTKGYSDDWEKTSSKVRASVGYQCQHCEVNLSSDKRLLHVHHRNGVKSDNSAHNLIALCADCHRKEPYHGHMFVKHSDTQRINELRAMQNVYASCDWNTVFKKADPSVHGILEHCKVKGYTAPEVAYSLPNNPNSKALELAWTKRRFGVVLSDPIVVDGWHILSLADALEYFAQRKK